MTVVPSEPCVTVILSAAAVPVMRSCVPPGTSIWATPSGALERSCRPSSASTAARNTAFLRLIRTLAHLRPGQQQPGEGDFQYVGTGGKRVGRRSDNPSGTRRAACRKATRIPGSCYNEWSDFEPVQQSHEHHIDPNLWPSATDNRVAKVSSQGTRPERRGVRQGNY